MTNYHHIQPQPLCGALGAEIHDVDIASGVSEVQFAEIRRAFHQFGVIFFRDQELTPEQQIAFARRWGRINVNRFFQPVDGYPEVAEVRKEPGHKNNIGGSWHTDHSYDNAPAMGSIWDNRATWHRALNDYQGERRVMHRITVEGVALS